MVNFQLCSRDEYGQASILMSSPNLEEITKEAIKQVNSINVDNALSVDDKKRNWSAYYVHLLAGKKDKYIYAEKDNRGKAIAYSVKSTVTQPLPAKPLKKPVEGEVRVAVAKPTPIVDFSTDLIPVSDIKNCKIKVFLGVLDGKDWYAEDTKGNAIDSLSHPDLEAKTVFFIKKA